MTAACPRTDPIATGGGAYTSSSRVQVRDAYPTAAAANGSGSTPPPPARPGSQPTSWSAGFTQSNAGNSVYAVCAP